MKTPREILLTCHQAAAPKLDAIRRSVVAELNNQETKEQSALASFVALMLRCPNKLWQEIIWPSRRIWAGLAVAWLLMVSINVSLRDGSGTATAKFSPMTPMTFREQQQMLNELFADRLPQADTDRPKPFSPKPRTETTEFFTV